MFATTPHLSYIKAENSCIFENFKKESFILKKPKTWVASGYEQQQKKFFVRQNENEMAELETIKNFNWVTADENSVKTFTNYILNLVSAKNIILVPCFKMLISNLFPHLKPPEKVPLGNKENTGTVFIKPEEEKRIFDYIHTTINRILLIVPTGCTSLFPILEEFFPHKREDLEKHKIYLNNVLRISDYVPVLRERLLALVVDKLLSIDVEIRLEDFIDDDEDLQFEVELETKDSFKIKDPEQRIMAEKLDAMMSRTFEYLKEQSEIQHVSEDTFRYLLQIFDRSILNTHKSKYTQFLLFYMCSLQANYSEAFLGYLLHKLLYDNNTHPIGKQACACYIGSFIARATFLQIEAVIGCLKRVLEWAHHYIEDREKLDLTQNIITSPDADVHFVFYSVCQLIFYVFCFRHEQLKSYQITNKENVAELNLEHLIKTKLNPLKVCLPSVVREFVKVVKGLNIVDCTNIMDRNSKIVLSTKSNQLESFFPFDPFLLKISSKFIHPIYQIWKGPAIFDKECNINDHNNGNDDDNDEEPYPIECDNNDDDELENIDDSLSTTGTFSFNKSMTQYINITNLDTEKISVESLSVSMEEMVVSPEIEQDLDYSLVCNN